MKKKTWNIPAFEDSLGDDWSHDLNIAEVPLGNRPLFYLGIAVFVIVLAVAGQVIYLNFSKGPYYEARAVSNVIQSGETPAPRGLIYERNGDLLAENQAAFSAVLDPEIFLKNEALQQATLDAIETILGISAESVWSLLNQANEVEYATPVVLAENLTENQLVNLQALNMPTIKIENKFARVYPKGPTFSSIVGYIGRVTQNDLEADASLTHQDFIGKVGIEAFYDKELRGVPGVNVQYKNARGQTLAEKTKSSSAIGASIRLTIDGGLQSYTYTRLKSGLASLGRRVGVAIAMNPETGEILSLVNLPGFDNNLFSQPGSSTARAIQSLFTSPDKPLFDRAVNGFYNPGSTIKPLVGVAALEEGVIDSTRTIFSPGYLLVPNPYNSSTPSKYLDWRYQGSVDMGAALAQSSDVYFYIVGGGSPIGGRDPSPLNDASDYGVSGLGINRLHDWWQKFGLGQPTGIDMPNEADGFLPTPTWKQNKTKTPWLLGDTYNVSIGQGDLLVSPLQLLDYISAIANGGKVYRLFLNASSTPQVAEDLSDALPSIQAVEQGMRKGVTSPLGTAHTMNDLPFSVCAKTGSAQVQNNTQENALFVGYAPCDNPKIALLILIENSKEGSLNAVPIAKDVLNWYYENRLK